MQRAQLHFYTFANLGLMLLVSMTLMSCLRGGGGSDATESDMDLPPQDPGLFVAGYTSNPEPGFLEGLASNLGNNDMYKLAENSVILEVRPSEDTTVSEVLVTVDDVEVARLFPEGLAVGETLEVTLPLELHPVEEGIQPIVFTATYSDGSSLTAEEEVRILLNVSRLTQVAGGRMWLGTMEYGLTAYDLGIDPIDPSDDRFLAYSAVEAAPRTVMTLAGVEEDPNSVVGQACTALELSEDGGLWYGSLAGGFSYLDDGGTPFDQSDDQVSHFMPSLVTNPSMEDGCDPNDVFCFTDQALQDLMRNSVTAMAVDGDVGLWIGTFDGLYYLDHGGTPLNQADDSWHRYDSDSRYDPNLSQVMVDDNGLVWLSSFDLETNPEDGNALVVLDHGGTPLDPADDTWGRFPELTDAMSNQLYTVAIDSSDVVWVGGTNGLFALDHGGTPFDPSDDQFAQRTTEHGLPDVDVASILPRGDGTVWVGSIDVCGGEGGGLSFVDLSFGGRDQPGCEDLASDPLLYQQCAAVSPSSDDVVVNYTLDDGLIDSDVATIVELESGAVVIGTFNLLAAPVVAAVINYLTGEELHNCEPGERPEENPDLNPDTPTATVGRDGLSVIDPGGSIGDKADDQLVNL